MALPGKGPTDFMEILEKLWWKLDRALLWKTSVTRPGCW